MSLTRRATLAMLVLIALGTGARASLDDDAVRARTRSVLEDPEYQTQRPDGSDAPEPERNRERTRERSGGSDGARPEPSPVRAPSEISQVLIWIVLGGIVLFVAILLVSQARRSIRRRGTVAPRRVIAAPEQAHGELDADKLDETLRAAMTLANDGRFEEAVHVLLTGAIHELQQNVGLPTQAASTSRELLAAANLRPDPQRAFSELVFAVEVSLFGGLAVSRADFDRCATSFRTLRQAVA